MHICASKLNIIGSDTSLSPSRRPAIIWSNAGILLIGPLGTNSNEISININTFSMKKMHLKMLSGIWRPFCPNLNVLIQCSRNLLYLTDKILRVQSIKLDHTSPFDSIKPRDMKLTINQYSLRAGNYQQPKLPSANMADADLDTNYIRCPCNYKAPIPGVRGSYTSE